METQVAADLANALRSIEAARQALLDADTAQQERLVELASSYERTRREAGHAFRAAADAFDADNPSEAVPGPPPGELSASAPPAYPEEASPGVPLVPPPGVVVNAENIATFGSHSAYRPKPEDPDQPLIQVTNFAFAAGTAVEAVKGNPIVGLTQASRIVVGEGGVLGIITNDTFLMSYEKAEPSVLPTPDAAPPASEPAPAVDDGEAGDS